MARDEDGGALPPGDSRGQERDRAPALDRPRAGPLPDDRALEPCLHEMLDSVNRLWRRRTLAWQTAAEAWSARPPLTVDRDALHEEVTERAHAIAQKLSGRGQPADLAERLAIEQRLTGMGLMRQQRGGWC